MVEESGCYKCPSCNKVKCTLIFDTMNKAIINYETIPKTQDLDTNSTNQEQ